MFFAVLVISIELNNMRVPFTTAETLRAWLLSALVVHGAVGGNPDAKRLYDDLLSNYNKLVRPVVNTSDVLKVSIKLKLSQLIDVVSHFPFKYTVIIVKRWELRTFCDGTDGQRIPTEPVVQCRHIPLQSDGLDGEIAWCFWWPSNRANCAIVVRFMCCRLKI